MPSSRAKQPAMNHPVVLTFLILAIVGAMSAASEVLKPLALSVLLAFALTPVSAVLQRRARLPRALAVILTVVLALGSLGAVGYVVGGQLSALAARLPDDQERINKKLAFFQASGDSAFQRASKVAGNVAEQLDKSPLPTANVSNVRVVSQPNFRERLQEAVGPYLEFLGVGSFVLVLVLFMMMNPEDLRDRIVQLFGQGRVSLTTRTMDEIGQRISRYLATFALVNSTFGVAIGVGLWGIGLPYALLWGCIAALARFIPYVGTGIAFALPAIFAFAHFPGWAQVLEVVALFAILETLLNSVLEPVIYGKTTGVSALGLLVAAMFWTWLWGLLGLLLSTPLTVCLAVLGKYVPSLGFFATLLGEEAELEPDVRFYQRLVALDRDGAVEVVDAALKTQPRLAVFDSILLPALSRAERDVMEGNIEESDQAFACRVVGEVLDELEGEAEITLATVVPSGDGAVEAPSPATPAAPRRVVGVPANDTSDVLALKMLGQVLEGTGAALEVVPEALSPMALAERIAAGPPALVVLSHLPPQGLTAARYQVRRLRSRFAALPVVVGRWGGPIAAGPADSLSTAGATTVVASLAQAREEVLALFGPKTATVATAPPEARPDLVNVGP